MEAALVLDGATIRVLAWLAAGLTGLAVAWRRGPRTGRAVALLTTPVWLTFWNIMASIEVLADPNSVLRAFSQMRLSRLFYRSILSDFGYLGAGVVLLARPGGARNLAAWLRNHGWPTGGRTETASIRVGFLLFPPLIVVAAMTNWVLYGQQALVNGDETNVWANMTPYHAIFISLAAGFTEEILYRGLILMALTRVVPTWVAVVLQAAFFGFAHAGYGTWAHVIGPALFGLFMGFVAMRWGIWAAIVLHVLADVAAFGFDAAANEAWFGTLLTVALLTNLAYAIGAGFQWTLDRWKSRPSA